MPGKIQTEDVVRYGYISHPYSLELGDLPNARSALKGSRTVTSIENTSGLRMKLILDGWGRLAVAWEHADVDCAPFVYHGTIDVYAENGETLLHAEVKLQPFPPSQFGVFFGSLERTNGVHHGTFRVIVDVATSASARRLMETPESASVSSKVFTAFTYEQSPQDVCFVFPATHMKLWTSSKILIDQSAYYRSLLEGDFSESATHTSPAESDSPESKAGAASRLYVESDDETDEHFANEIAKGVRSTLPNLPHKKVVISDAAFTTYQATLVWMSSRYIRFAPLRSSKIDSACEGSESRLQDIIKTVEVDPKTPLPASPKSIYRLAHLLELKELQDTALENLSSQLTVHNAATELFSDVASTYPALRDVVLDFVVRRWTGVRSSKAWKQVQERADAHEVPAGAAHTAMLLSARIFR